MTEIALTIANDMPQVAGALRDLPSPRALVAYPYWKDFQGVLAQGARVRDYLLDSGAYSARNTGRPVVLDDYIGFCRERAADPACRVIFALDEIGSWEGTSRNLDRMVAAGLDVVPTFHIGEPWEWLDDLARRFPRLALGGLVGGGNAYVQKRPRPRAERLRWIEACFTRVWPKWIHGFGIKDPGILRRVPFASVDSANWFTDPLVWGKWKSLSWNYQRRGPRTRKDSPIQWHLRGEVDWWLRLERELQQQWGAALAGVASLPGPVNRKKVTA